jgi:hypothetical protein
MQRNEQTDKAVYNTPKKGTRKRKPNKSLAGTPNEDIVSSPSQYNNVNNPRDKIDNNMTVQKVFISYITFRIHYNAETKKLIKTMKDTIEWLVLHNTAKANKEFELTCLFQHHNKQYWEEIVVFLTNLNIPISIIKNTTEIMNNMIDIKGTKARAKQKLSLENILVVRDLTMKGKKTYRSKLVSMDTINRYQIYIVDNKNQRKREINHLEQKRIKVLTYGQLRTETEKHKIYNANIDKRVIQILCNKTNTASIIINNEITACESLTSINRQHELGISNIDTKTWQRIKDILQKVDTKNKTDTYEAKLSKFDGEKALKKHLAIELSKPSDERTLKVSTLLRQHDGIEEIVKLSWEQTKKTRAEEKEGNLRQKYLHLQVMHLEKKLDQILQAQVMEKVTRQQEQIKWEKLRKQEKKQMEKQLEMMTKLYHQISHEEPEKHSARMKLGNTLT